MNENYEDNRLSPWVLRIELYDNFDNDNFDMNNENPRLAKGIQISEVVSKIKSNLNKSQLQIIHSDDNDIKQVIRIRHIHDSEYMAPISPEYDDDGQLIDQEKMEERRQEYYDKLEERDEI